jgi:phage baseplate assembly protein W
MAIKDTSRKPFIEDRKENVFVGIDLPFRKSNGIEGWFTSTTTTIESVKNNIRNLLNTHKGERYMQPTLGLNLRNYMFEQITIDLQDTIKTEILETFNFWLPFVQIQNLDIDILESSTSDKNKLTISVLFNIVRDPNTTESVQVEIGD